MNRIPVRRVLEGILKIPEPIIRGLACLLYVSYEQYTQGIFTLDDDLQLGKGAYFM